MLWNRNMLLTDIRRTPGSLLMTFWKIFKIGMTFFQNFRKKSSAPRNFFKKLSKVTQIRFSNPLTTYFGFRAFWRLFLNLSSFLWILKKKKFFFFKPLNEISKKNFFSFENRKIKKTTCTSVFIEISSRQVRNTCINSVSVQGFTPIRKLWGCPDWQLYCRFWACFGHIP